MSLTNNKTKIILLSPFSLKVSNIACAIKLAVERFKADIITMSLGAIFYFFDGYNNIVYDAIDYVMNLTNNKTLIFIAAGNSGNTKYHKRLVSGTINLKNLQNFLSNVPDPIEIVFKNYVRGKYNISFFSGTVLLAEINWNETKNNYDLKVYSSQIDFDPKNYGFPNIVQLESGKSNETNLIIYFNTTLDNITITLTPLNTSFTTDFYFMAYKYYNNFDVLEEGDGYGTINLLAIHPAVFTIGSLTTIDKVYFFENSSKDYMYYFYNNGIIGNMSLFSSKSLNDVDNFTFKKIDLIAPGTLFGANYLKDYYAIYKKTNNYGVTPEFTLFSNSFNWISYITFKKGTSIATPFAASIFASMKSIIKNGDVWLFKRLLPYISFDTQYTQGLSEIEKGKGIININKAFNILPQISLEFYSIDYLNKTLNLTVNVFNNLNVPYNLTFLQIEFKDNNGKKYFNFTNLAYGINNLILNLSQLNISYNGSTYNLTFKGDILEYKTYQITINGTKINIKNATLYLDLIYNGSFFVNNSILQLDLNYSYNYLGTVFCDLFINNNKTNSFNISKFGLSSINFSIKDFLSLNPTNIKIYCDKNSEIINYNLEIKDFILETKIDIIEEPVEIINLTIINLANLTNLENNSIVLPIYLNITIKNLNLTKNYLLKHKENISETLNLTYNKNFDFTAKSFDLPLKNKNKVFDLLTINVLSKINFTDFEILSLNIKNNTYYLDFVLNLDRLTRIDNKECAFYFYKNKNLIENKELYDEFFIKETFLSNETKKIRLKTFKNFYNINLDTEINISIVFNCSNNFIKIQSINKTVFYNSSDIFFYDYNISLKRKSFFEDLNISFNLTNPSSYLIVIFEKFNKSFYSKEYNSTTSFFNISLLLSWIEFNKRLLDLIKEKIGSEPFIYSYNLNKSLTNNPNKFIFDKYYNFSIVSKVYYPFNKNATYISIEKEIKYKQEGPKLFLLSNRSSDTYNLTWFGNLSWWFLELINNESKELNLSTYLKLELESKNITSKKTILIKNKTKLLLFNYSKIKEDILKDLKEGEFNLSAYFYLNYSNLSLPLIKFEDKLYFDLIYPQIINFTIYKAIKIYNKINNASKAFYNLEEYNKLNNTYYTNDNAFVKIYLYEKNFDNYFSVDLAIN
ncbi:MAG TPA: hypothetical protein EYH54_04630, partial [Nautiliaceae bacterium]|nr:hypothetical protein [Nautiliaceae bacterium]